MLKKISIILIPLMGFSLDFSSTNGYDIRTKYLKHPSAYIPSMCYTKTIDKNNKAHNPCFACHVKNTPPNFVLNDDILQTAYLFPQPASVNPFKNLFKDFSKRVAQISDKEILEYIDKSNYLDENENIILAKKLANLPKEWDYDGDGKWSGYIPDCYFNFDKDGFDRDKKNKPTGWVAFAYMPFLGTFWPTNGSTDDVLIRLSKAFRTNTKDGEFNATIYKVNLAIVESLIKRADIPIPKVNEKKLGVDLDKDGKLSFATKIKYDWAPLKNRFMYYVGYAKKLQKEGKIHLAAGLYPEGTEFLHSVRYIRPLKNGEITLSNRMKELRYAKKLQWLNYATLKNKGLANYQEKDLSPDELEVFSGNIEIGIYNKLGWVYQGFIEDKNGNLRPQSYEESLNCIGCHSGVGVITDSTYAFPRKLNNYKYGWYHWSEKYLKNVPEFQYINKTYEYSNYLKLNNSGNEFRTNEEVIKKFFNSDGSIKQEAIEKLHKDVSYLLYPSYKRAIMLNKAYKALVETQTFIDGKVAHIKPLKNVYKEVPPEKKTGNKIYNPPPIMFK